MRVGRVWRPSTSRSRSRAGRGGTTTRRRDIRLRVGLHSGEVIAGEIGSRKSYTTVGDQVGMAQRMESVARPAG